MLTKLLVAKKIAKYLLMNENRMLILFICNLSKVIFPFLRHQESKTEHQMVANYKLN